MSEAIRKWTVTASFAVLALAALLFALHGFVPLVQAQDVPPARTAECNIFRMVNPPVKAEWMNEQLRAGRTDFVWATPTVMCAW